MMIEPARRPLCSKRGGNLVESQNFDTGETSHMGRLNTNRYNDLNSSMFKAADSNRVGMRETNRETKGLGTIGNLSQPIAESKSKFMTSSSVSRFSVKISIHRSPRFHALYFFLFFPPYLSLSRPAVSASRDIISTISTIVTRQPVGERSYPPISTVLPRS